MNYTQEYFSSELVLPRLVEWFNALPEPDRHVVSGEMFIIRVKVLENEAGEPIFAINTDPTTGDATRKYIGESVYLWIGPSGENLTATNNTFFELSKFIQTDGGQINVIPFKGTIFTAGAPVVEELIRRMGFGVNYNYSFVGDNGNTHGLTADGTVQSRSDLESYMAPNISQKFKTVVGGGYQWSAGLTDAGDVYVWGGDGTISTDGSVPTKIEIGSTKFKQIAALYRSLVLIDVDGNLQLYGNASNTPESSDWEASYFMDQPQLSTISKPAKDVRGFYRVTPADGVQLMDPVMQQWAFITFEDQSVMVWGSNTAYFTSSPQPDNSRYSSLIGERTFIDTAPIADFRGCGAAAVVLFTDGTATLFGHDTLSLNGEPGASPGSTGIKEIGVTNHGRVIILKTDGELWVTNATHSNPTWDNPYSQVVTISAGYDHYALLTTDGEVYDSYGGLVSQFADGGVVKVHAGHLWSYAVMEDGSLEWWPRPQM